jgi:uncharacterized protein
MIKQFEDPLHGGFYATDAASQSDLLTRLKEGEDNAVPSANGVAAHVLLRLASLTGETTWRRRAARAVQAFQPLETRAPAAFPTLLAVYEDLGTTGVVAPPASVVQVSAEGEAPGRSENVTVNIRLSIQPGWHVNAHVPSEKELIPTTVELTPTKGATLARVDYAPPRMVQLVLSPDPLAVYQGDVTLRAVVRMVRWARPARRSLRFTVRYQPCSERACLAPAKSEVSVTLLR